MIKLLSLFSGIGAFEKALTNLGIGYELVNYCEINKFASKAYSLIHNESENKNLWDVTKVNEELLPDFNLMTWGFPCQSISIAGKQEGFFDEKGNKTRSGLYYDGLRILSEKLPKYSIIENVKALTFRKFKNEFNSMLSDLKSLGYNNYWKVLNAKDYGIPQNRERVFIVSIRKDVDEFNFKFPEKQELKIKLADIIEEGVTQNEISYCLDAKYSKGTSLKQFEEKKCSRLVKIIDDKFSKSRPIREYEDYSPCLDSMGGGNRQPKIKIQSYPLRYLQRNQKNFPTDYSMCIDTSNTTGIKVDEQVRKLTTKECFRLMGFTDEDHDKLINISNTQKYKVAGNSIVINVLEEILKCLFKEEKK